MTYNVNGSDNIDNNEDNFTRLKKIISEELKVDMEAITLKARLEDNLGADSLEVVELVMVVEREFGLEINDNLASQIVTVGDLLRYTQR